MCRSLVTPRPRGRLCRRVVVRNMVRGSASGGPAHRCGAVRRVSRDTTATVYERLARGAARPPQPRLDGGRAVGAALRAQLGERARAGRARVRVRMIAELVIVVRPAAGGVVVLRRVRRRAVEIVVRLGAAVVVVVRLRPAAAAGRVAAAAAARRGAAAVDDAVHLRDDARVQAWVALTLVVTGANPNMTRHHEPREQQLLALEPREVVLGLSVRPSRGGARGGGERGGGEPSFVEVVVGAERGGRETRSPFPRPPPFVSLPSALPARSRCSDRSRCDMEEEKVEEKEEQDEDEEEDEEEEEEEEKKDEKEEKGHVMPSCATRAHRSISTKDRRKRAEAGTQGVATGDATTKLTRRKK